MLIPLIRRPISTTSEETNSSFVWATLTALADALTLSIYGLKRQMEMSLCLLCALLMYPSIRWKRPLSSRDEKAFRAAIDSRND
ncbi:hypothetical protein FVEG_04180 [Fusarium verticillioides 7600]|uniref:Uncharacterized protein n=1 Tax=Gibberella moniliformis (strain M3125 / FGSC 7600) TaxID=334819 RepID=W7MBU1_GIBM7|nr:hypothetical protein FVEG_04180 [Fusarium verticillioides 7600]EWG42342.1 hypothetical protein FVEG_04180 [Fusarium verticillioides 7600]